MKIALLGSGKTGSELKSLVSDITVFNSSNVPTIDKLDGHDVIISFLPGPIFLEFIPMLIQSKIPVVTGSTGFKWPSDLEESLIQHKLKWVKASNFSLGINIVKEMTKSLSKISKFYEDFTFSIDETHHTDKLDAPSGTALSIESWLDQNSTITSNRLDDVIGEHTVRFECIEEQITLKHVAKDRSVFAKGALWSANYILQDDLKYGLYNFDVIVKEKIYGENI